MKDSHPPGKTSPAGILFRPGLPSGNMAIWLLTQELWHVRRDNQSLRQHVEHLTKTVSVMETRLAALEQAPCPDVAEHSSGTVLVPCVEKVQTPLADLSEAGPMDCGRTGTDLLAGPPEAVESGEDPSAPTGNSLPPPSPSAASIPDSSLLHISPQEDRRLFEEAKGDIAKYALAVFRRTVLQDYFQRWRGKANVSGTHQKAALSPNLVNAAFKAAKRWKPKLSRRDYSNIKIQINRFMRYRKSRSLVVSPGQV
nr:uncharacterized protein LOC112546363 isoform X2 [Pelodiscus sinensis]XP_025042196.1 uncharacterized protein LOC112546363 isoform X2 [Pelodiscus sinensis]|eukprot:XP_025042195.1 uncharacterized protein LOC112546363 isoform X2 [Pelodiscus sinensis]